MSFTICFDFGNTRLKAAIFNKKTLTELRIVENDNPVTIQAIIDEFKPEKTILSSVVHHNKTIEELLAKQSKFHLLGPNSLINFTAPVGKPETIGADRLALVAAAVDLYPQQHNLIISLGTCITYNFVNISHEFIGGSISPGMQMRFRAMHSPFALD